MVLCILIVGGGLAGLATAVSLRRAGHHIQIFEASQAAYKDVVGPIVHIGPKNNDLLRQWEFDAAAAKGILIREVYEVNQDGMQRSSDGASQPPGWEFYERSRLHKALLNSATSSTGPGQPAKIFLGTPVTSVDPDTAKVTLNNGQVFQGDLVVGADGFHSNIRQSIFKDEVLLSGSTKVATYFTIAVTQLDYNSVVQRFQNQPERYEKWFGSGLQLNVYAVEPQTLLFDCTVAMQKETGVSASMLKKRIQEAFTSAHPELVQLLAQAELKDIHFWTQPSLPNVPKWTYKRLVLVGDAAHPFLPHELPGTSQALLDAAALSAKLRSDVGAEKIEQHLTAWEIQRKERVAFIQQMERQS